MIRQAALEGGASGFLGGLVGFVGYDAVRYFEELPSRAPDVLGLPDLYLMVTDHLALFDHMKRTLRLIVNVPVDPKTNLKKAYAQAVRELSRFSKQLGRPLSGMAEIPVSTLGKSDGNELFGFEANMKPEKFEAM